MSGRSNYRVKVDLSKYHQDARRFSWIYVNSTNVWFISQLKLHIKDVFGIDGPFHLLLNGNEYLPSAEDVRVLNENEIIVVEPGTGISSDNGSVSAMSMPTSDMENGFVKDISTTDEAAPYQHKTKHEAQNGGNSENQASNSSVANVSRPDATMYHSILDVTEIESSSDSRQKNDSVEYSFGAIDQHGVPLHKRKRIRRKKNSKQSDASIGEIVDNRLRTSFNKPKIVNSFTLPSGTHIRFDNNDNSVTSKIEKVGATVTSENGIIITTKEQAPLPFFKNSKIESLSSLLAMRNCSSPLTFANKKRKNKNDNGSELQTENDDTMQSSNGPGDTPSLQSSRCSSVNIAAERANEEANKYANVKLDGYPCLEAPPKIGDTVAFKVLRMGQEYTPEVSGYIVAQTLSYCPKKMLYTFRVLQGRSEIEIPTGKFSLPETEDADEKNDTVEFNSAQLIEPRLLDRK